MKTNVKNCLLGGTLIGTGLCSSAVAGAVNWFDGSGGTVSVGDYQGSGGLDAQDDISHNRWNVNVGYDRTEAILSQQYASSRGGTFGFDLAAEAGVVRGSGFGEGRAAASGSFTVATDTSILFSWHTDGGPNIAFLSILDPSGTAIIGAGGGPLSNTGSFEYTFIADQTYTISAQVSSERGIAVMHMSDGTLYVVPLPPAVFAGLGMLAGLGAYRRIRK